MKNEIRKFQKYSFSEKIVEISEFITPGNILFTIIDLNPIKVQGYLSEYDVNKVQIGTKTNIMISNTIIDIT